MALSHVTPANFISGYHDLFYSDRDPDDVTLIPRIGSTGPEGIRLNLSKNFHEIKGDALGADTTVDSIVQGGNLNLEFVLQELNLNVVRQFIAPARETTSPTTRPSHNEVGLVGHLGSSISGALYAVPREDTPADRAHHTAAGATRKTVRKFVGHVINDLPETLDSTMNVIPVQFLCFPFQDALAAGSRTVWFDWLDFTSDSAGLLTVALQIT